MPGPVCHVWSWLFQQMNGKTWFWTKAMRLSPCVLLLLQLSRFSRVRLCVTPQTAARQAPLSLGFSRQEHWSGLPFPSPMHESEKWKWSLSVVSDSLRLHGLQPTRLLRPWNFPGKSTGVWVVKKEIQIYFELRSFRVFNSLSFHQIILKALFSLKEIQYVLKFYFFWFLFLEHAGWVAIIAAFTIMCSS